MQDNKQPLSPLKLKNFSAIKIEEEIEHLHVSETSAKNSNITSHATRWKMENEIEYSNICLN